MLNLAQCSMGVLEHMYFLNKFLNKNLCFCKIFKFYQTCKDVNLHHLFLCLLFPL